MDLGLAGKVAAITGGSAGIGKAVALEFAKEGCRVAICGRRRDRLEQTERELRALGCQTYIQPADVTKISELESFADHICRHFGRMDIWVNNVGATMPKPILDCSEADWDYACALNLKSVFFGAQFAMKRMIQGNVCGVILNVTTYAAILPAVGAAVYAATKSGIHALTRTFAAECAPYGIRVVSVAPGTTHTEMTEQALSAFEKQRQLDDIASRRFAMAEEIARPIVFIASDASSYVNGVLLEVSGGKFCVQRPVAAWNAR